MLYHLLVPFSRRIHALYLFNYITFRAAMAAVTALLIAFIVGPWIIQRLRGMQMHQVVREGTPETHAGKGTTPTMGGLIMLVALGVSTLLWAKLNNRQVIIALFVTLWMGGIGFLDDWLKFQQRQRGEKNRGLVERYKLAGQVSIGVFLGWYLWQHPVSPLCGACTTLPFFKYILVVPASAYWAWVYVPFVTFVLTGTSNAVNITDGVDGLAAGLIAISAATFAVFAYIIGRFDTSAYLHIFYLRGSGELTVFCTAMVGAAMGFLWFNAHPAQVFMGDTGALALGGAIGVVAILLKSEFLLLIVGGMFVAEMMSVILQRYVYKYRKRRYGVEYADSHRVFKRAPLHHHFEVSGWPESQVVVRFWILGILFAALALSTLKVR